MNRFVIIDGLPFLYADNKIYAVRWDSKGFTVGGEVKKDFSPYPLYSDLEIKAKCAVLDSIDATKPRATGSKKKAADE